jgi:hypothetical protein
MSKPRKDTIGPDIRDPHPDAQKGVPSAYARMQKRVRQNETKRERDRRLAWKNVCGAKRANKLGKCMRAAGWGTKHPGVGRCRDHGGLSPQQGKHVAKVYAHELLGTPMDINPFDAILWCIRIRAGEVQWLSDRMGELEKTEWVENTLVGKQFHLFARERVKAMQDLAKFSALAVSLGIAERAVKLAETYGELLAQYTKNLLNDLWPYLDEEGRAKAHQFVRLRLIQLDQGREAPEPPQIKQIAAG